MTKDASEEKVLADVRDFGWHVVLVAEDEVGPGFAFTIGLFRNYGHPEVIIFGLANEVMHAVLNLIGEAVKAGQRFTVGDRSSEFLEGYKCAFAAVPRVKYESFFGYARWFYNGDAFPALQCVWPDSEGRFPWEELAVRGDRQPVLAGGLDDRGQLA